MLGDALDLARVHHLGHDGQPTAAPHLGQRLERLLPQSAERVGRCPRLERARAQHGRARCADPARRHLEHLERFDRARAGGHGDLGTAEAGGAHAHDGRTGGELARRELVRLQHRQHLLDAGDRQDRHFAQPILISDATDDGAALPARDVRAQAQGLDALADVVDLGVRDAGLRDDDHGRKPQRRKKKKALERRGPRERAPPWYQARARAPPALSEGR